MSGLIFIGINDNVFTKHDHYEKSIIKIYRCGGYISKYGSGIVSDHQEITSNLDNDFHEIVKREFPDQAYIQDDGTIGYRPSKNEDGYVFGNPNFPVARYRELILELISNNLITIVTARTGTGKSTNIPQYLLESGDYDRIYVTQPRVLATRELMIHVSSEIAEVTNDREHKAVGFRTAVEANYSDDNVIQFVTDGLQLMHEIYDQGVQSNEVLVIDEFHERSANMDALLAIAVQKGIRVVIMSATLDAVGLSEHYEAEIGTSVPIIDIPGVSHEVKEREATSFDQTIVDAAKEGKNILVFLPGRKEITSALSRIGRRVPKSYTLLSLSADQTPDVQKRVMSYYPGGKIIFSTAIGQTSITIPDIDVVVDCGYERTNTLEDDGVTPLATQVASRATSEQRRGRVGRTKPGEYIIVAPSGFPPLPPKASRPEYDTPEIQRMRLDELQLKLQGFGHTILSLPFYQMPKEVEVLRSNERLSRLGLIKMVGEVALGGYELTEIGKIASKMPLDVNSARMLIEARKYGKEVELQMMAAVAVLQINGITLTQKGMNNWRSLSKEVDSDIIAGIDYMVEALLRTEEEQRVKHIVKLRYDKALRSFENLARRRNIDYSGLKKPDEAQRQQLHDSVIVGTSEVFVTHGKYYLDRRRQRRTPVSNSRIEDAPEFITGIAFNLQQVRSKKIITNHLINSATKTSYEELKRLIPERVSTRIDKLYVNPSGDPVTERTISFDGFSTLHKITVPADPGPELQRFIIEHIFSNKKLDGKSGPNILAVRAALNDLRDLQHKTTENLGIDYSIHQIVNDMLHTTNYMSQTFNDVDPFIDSSVMKNIIPNEVRKEIEDSAPMSIAVKLGRMPVNLPVMYRDNNAYVTAQGIYYSQLAPTIGHNHKMYVREPGFTKYHVWSDAFDDYKKQEAEDSRERRRGGKAIDSDSLLPEIKTQTNRYHTKSARIPASTYQRGNTKKLR
jgi:HrpA-like RNA helicase